MIIIEYVRFSGFHHSKLWFYGCLAAVEEDFIITDLTGIGAVSIAFNKNQWNQTIEKNPYQCIKNWKTIRLLYSTITKWTVTYFVPVSFAFHDDDTVTWNNNLYYCIVNYAEGVRFYWIKNAILIIRFNVSCMYDCVVYLEQRHVSRAMHSIKYYNEIISNPLGENST